MSGHRALFHAWKQRCRHRRDVRCFLLKQADYFVCVVLSFRLCFASKGWAPRMCHFLFQCISVLLCGLLIPSYVLDASVAGSPYTSIPATAKISYDQFIECIPNWLLNHVLSRFWQALMYSVFIVGLYIYIGMYGYTSSCHIATTIDTLTGLQLQTQRAKHVHCHVL